MKFRGKSLSVSEFFCGAGGLSYGFTQAGIPCYLGMDFSDTAQNVFRVNHPGARFLRADIHTLSQRQIFHADADIRILCGAPPCQGFSHVGQLHEATKTGELGKHKRGIPEVYARYVAQLKPRPPDILALENVPQILKYGGGEIWRRFTAILEDAGYALCYDVLDLRDFGLAQDRQRLIMLATRLGGSLKLPTGSSEHKTLADAFEGLRPLRNGERDPKDPLHYAPRLSAQRERRYRFLLKKKPQLWSEVPYSLLPRRIKAIYGDTKLMRARRVMSIKGWHEQARTLVRKYGGLMDGAQHPSEPRPYNLREMARIQGFPDSFDFRPSEISRAAITGLIAGAVSPKLSAALASEVLDYVGRL